MTLVTTPSWKSNQSTKQHQRWLFSGREKGHSCNQPHNASNETNRWSKCPEGRYCSCFPCPATPAVTVLLVRLCRVGFSLPVSAMAVWSLFVHRLFCLTPPPCSREVFDTSIFAVLSCPRFAKSAESRQLPQKYLFDWLSPSSRAVQFVGSSGSCLVLSRLSAEIYGILLRDWGG